jgi:hypothetical protein
VALAREDLRLILEDVKWGAPRPGVVEQVARELAAQDYGPSEQYTALHIVARTCDPRFEGLVASFLESPDNPMLSRLALQALCLWLEKTDSYIADVERFVDGVAWDFGDVRSMALEVAGSYLQAHRSGLLFRLIGIAESELEARTVRENAIRALAVALSDKTEDLTASKKVEVGGPWWQDVLSRAYARGLSE